MTLNEKKEIFKAKEAELNEKVKSLDGLKVKAATATDEDLDKINADVEAIESAVETLKADIAGLDEEIEEEEKSIEDLKRKGTGNMEKFKNKSVASNDGYLKTKEAMNDFADVLIKHAGGSKEDIKNAWKDHLATKGITNPEVLFPDPVVESIQDTFDAAGGIFATLNKKYGFTVWSNALNTVTDDTGRARGHKMDKSKKEQVITLAEKEISCDFIYKYLKIPKKVLKETQSTGAVVNYVLSELPQRIVWEIERAVTIGDGRAANSDDKITSFEAMADASASYVTAVGTTADLYTDLVRLVANIKASGDKYLITNSMTLAKLKTVKDKNDSLMLPVGSDIPALIGVKEIFTPEWFDEADAAGEIVAIAYTGDAYIVIGDETIENFDNFILAENKHEYLAELYTGGALMLAKSAAKLMQAAEA